MTENPFEFVDLTDRGRGFGPIAPPAGFPDGEKPGLLIAIEKLFTPVNRARDNSYISAVRKLALFGAGRLSLAEEEYQQLCELVDEYESIMRAPVHGYASNAKLARFVLEQARARHSS
jgi:hypothetical protein